MIKENVFKAYEFAKRKHSGQMRKYVELEYFSHCKYVARLLEETEDEDLICAGFLHDTLEDTDTTFDELVKEFNENVACLVKEVTNEKAQIKKLSKVIYLAQKILGLSYKAAILKLADRIHNLLFAETDGAPYEFKKKYYKESIQLLAVWKMRTDRDELMDKYISMLETILNFYNILNGGFKK